MHSSRRFPLWLLHSTNVKILAMGISQKINRLAAWIAVLAILLATLMPAISHAMVSRTIDTSAMQEICTSEGIKLAPHSDHGDQHHQPSEEGMHFEHCPYCITSASASALPSKTFCMPVIAGTRLVPLLFLDAAHPLFAWAAAQPRGPPAYS